MDNLINEIKVELIKALHLDGMKPEDLDADAPLFGEGGIGLDSIDALEIIVMLEKNYGIRLSNVSEGKEIFKSIRSIAEYVKEHKS
ncbi:MAG: acyl carrier protein [Prevotella sp.]|nr:acyl carrier protein [Prevotella sp.]